jgi:hypothetical protein
MLSPLRNRFGIPGVISVIALVFAMFGGAYAASNNGGGSGSKATASAKAKRGPRGPKGAKGDTGPAGPQGPAGAAGAKGDTGSAGSNGSSGSNGVGVSSTESSTTIDGTHCAGVGGSKFVSASGSTYACNGKAGKNGEDGEEGPEGPPGPTCNETTGECLLPEGATETGIWAARAPVPAVGESALVWAAISFPLRLSQQPTSVIYVTEEQQTFETQPPECPGTNFEPQAAPGILCLYVRTEHNIKIPTISVFSTPDRTSGLVMKLVRTNKEEEAATDGSWAMTGGPLGP